MKRIVILLTIIAALALTACGSALFPAPEDIDLDKAYSFSASMQFRASGSTFSASADFERVGEAVWNVTFTEPFALSGVEMVYDSGNLTSRFDGAEFAVPANGDAIVTQMIEAFEDAIGGEGREVVVIDGGRRGRDQLRVSSKTGARSRAYELIFDKKSQQPLTLVIADGALTVSFSRVQVSQIVQVIRPAESAA
jgi:hypothetical protein